MLLQPIRSTNVGGQAGSRDRQILPVLTTELL
jgi:hypothetical protein